MPLSDILLIAAAALIAFLGLQLTLAYRKLAQERAAGLDGSLRYEHALNQAQAERTAREGAEQALHTSEARTLAILEAAVDGVITIDEKGRIQSFNRAAERIFGYQAPEVLGRNVNVLMPDPDHSAHDLYLQNYINTGHARIIGIGREVVGRRKDGGTFPMHLAVGESRLEGRRIFAGIVRDLSESKRTEERLYQSEENLRLLVEGVRDYAITTMDGAGIISSWNRGAEQIHGWAAKEALGRNFSLFFTPVDVAASESDRVLAMARREGSYEGEMRQQRKDGTNYWAHVTVTPLRDDAGVIRGYVRIARDMTEQRTQEEALRQAKDEAERANFAKSKFLAAASHDLRQPLQALTFFTSALGVELKDTASAAMLCDVEASLSALNSLLESLLDISRLDAGAVSQSVEDFPLSPLLKKVESEFGPMAAAKRLILHVVPSGEFVHSDPVLLGRILNNLVDNAIRYTERGKIVVGCRRSGSGLRLEVWDTGIGIPRQRLDDIFEEFTQLGNVERDRAKGLGLGLAIARRLAALLGHPLKVHSEPGRGSAFAIEVPRAAHHVILVPERPTAHGGRRLVIVIDDEAPVLKGLGLILEQWGFDVIAAGSEEEAIDRLEALRQAPSAILADYRLRDGHTGAEAARHIRALFNAPIPSIIITGDTAPERIQEAEASGFLILHKPVQPPHLRTMLVRSMTDSPTPPSIH